MDNVICTVGMLCDDGTVDFIYVYDKGMPSYVGIVLMERYNNWEAVEYLLDLGNLEDIRDAIEISNLYSGNIINLGGCYNCTLEEYLNIDQDIADEGEEYRYLFQDGEWKCYDCYWEDIRCDNQEELDFYYDCLDRDTGEIDLKKFRRYIYRLQFDLFVEVLEDKEVYSFMTVDDYLDAKIWNIERDGVRRFGKTK